MKSQKHKKPGMVGILGRNDVQKPRFRVFKFISIPLFVTALLYCLGANPDDASDTILPKYRVATNFAIVIPFISRQLPRLSLHLTAWSKHVACDQRVTSLSSNIVIRLLFYSDEGQISRHAKTRLEAIFNDIGASKGCFSGGWDMIYGAVPKAINNHACGACYQFYKVFRILKGRYDYFFLMEPDILPIRSGWLTALYMETVIVSPGQDFWIKGSNQKCSRYYGDIARRRDWHINGNALYKVDDRLFEMFLHSVRSYYSGGMEQCPPGCGTGYMYENAYDHALFRFRGTMENFEDTVNLHHRFQYTPIIANLCEEMFNASEFAANHPEVFLVHSKGPDLPREYHEVQRIFHNVLTRHGSTDEVIPLQELLQSGKTIEYIIHLVCGKESKPSHYCYTNCRKLFKGASFMQNCASYKAFQDWAERFDDKVYLWSVDFHAAPASCNAEIYQAAGAVFHQEIDFSNCIFHNNCRKRLQVLSFDDWRGFGLDPCPNKLRHAFFDHYKDDPEMGRVDAIVCSHPVANCELFMPLNKSLIIYATTRIEFGRFDQFVEWRKKELDAQSPYRWAEWAQNLVRISKKPGNIIAANNLYDVFYIKYLTGIDAMYLPSWCTPKSFWSPTHHTDVILGPSRDNLGEPWNTEKEAWNHPLLANLSATNLLKGSKYNFIRYNELKNWENGNLRLESIAKYKAIVLIPYQVSFMSFFEYYRMNIPLFAPSKKLYFEWEKRYNVSWERVYGRPFPIIRQDPVGRGDPNIVGEHASTGWLELADIYNFPHIQYFNSWDHMIDLLEKVDLADVSKAMEVINREQKNELVQSWRLVFNKIRKYRSLNTQKMSKSFEDTLHSVYGTRFIGRDYKPGCLENI